MKITKKIARNLALRDDETPYGGKSHSDEHLDEFMAECEIPFGSTLEKVNKSLVDCGILPITEQQAIDASNPLFVNEEEILEKIARISRMDCWFGIDDKGRVYDREGDIKGKTEKTRRVLISQLIDGMTRETWDALTDYEKFNLIKGIGRCLNY